MTAFEERRHELMCNSRLRHADTKAAFFQGKTGVPRAKVRALAAKAGWTHVRSPHGRKFDKDYCPDHKLEAPQ